VGEAESRISPSVHSAPLAWAALFVFVPNRLTKASADGSSDSPAGPCGP
jgi:hypothetical protein